MTDDFKFTPIQLKPPPRGPFGLAGESKGGLGSRTSINPDAPGRGGTTSSFPTNGGYSGGDGGNSGGGGGGLPAGSSGSLLRHNGSDWVAIGTSISKGILINNDESYYWLSGASKGDLIYFTGGVGGEWIRLEAPQSGTHVLGVINGNLQYIETEGCEEEP